MILKPTLKTMLKTRDAAVTTAIASTAARRRSPENQRTPIYCVIPVLMVHSVEHFLANEVAMPELIKVIPSSDFNPET